MFGPQAGGAARRVKSLGLAGHTPPAAHIPAQGEGLYVRVRVREEALE